MERPHRVVVLGATGYVGGRLVPELLDAGFDVRCLTRTPAGLSGTEWAPRVEVVAGDLSNLASIAVVDVHDHRLPESTVFTRFGGHGPRVMKHDSRRSSFDVSSELVRRLGAVSIGLKWGSPPPMDTTDFNSELSRRIDELTYRLDQLEAALPLIPARALGLTRATARRIGVTATDVATDVGRQLERLGATANTALSTSVGQTRSAVERTSSTARRTTKEAIGQTRAQTARTGRVAELSVGDLLADATRSIDPEDGARPATLDDLTKIELYERAQKLDIEGRSSMSKRELVRAIRSA